jgi:TolA-binding protein
MQRIPIVSLRAYIVIGLYVALLQPFQQAAAQPGEGKSQAAIREFNATAALQNSGFYDRASAKWKTFLTKYPKDERIDRVTYYLGICQLHLKQYPEATASFQSVLTKFPQFKNKDGAQYNLAMAYYQTAAVSQKAEDYKAAAAAFGETVSKYAASPHAAKACYFQGESLYTAGDLPAAATAYSKVIQSFATSPLVPDTYYALGTTQQALGKHAEAAQTYQKFLANAAFQKHSLAGEIRLRLGMAQFDEGKFADAEKHFQAVSQVKDFPLADFAALRFGHCRMEAGDNAAAAAAFTDLEKRFPNSQYKAAAQLAAGRCYFQLDQFAPAIQRLQPLAGGNTVEAIEAGYWLGRTYLKDKKPQQAIDALNKVSQSIKQGPLAKVVADAKAAGDTATLAFVPHVEMTRIDALYEVQGQRKATIALYDAFHAANPKHALAPQAQYMGALASLGETDYAGARDRAGKFLANTDALFTGSELVPAVLYIAAEGFLLDEKAADVAANTAKAEQYYRQLVTKHPQHMRAPRANLRIGWCVYQAKKYDAAVAHLNGALAAFKDHEQRAEAQLLIGRSHNEMKREKEAVAAYDEALKSAPNWDRGDEVLLAAAQSMIALDDAAGASARLQQLVTKFPESQYRGQSLYQLGEQAQAQKQFDQAIARYNEVMQKDPQSEFAAPAQYGIGTVHFAKEEFAKAVDPLNKLLAGKADEDTTRRGRFLRGLVFQRLKQYDGAIKDLQYYLTNKPEGDMGFDAQYALAICQIGLKQYDPAKQTLTALLAAKPDYEHADKIYYELGYAYLNETEPDLAKAAESFRALIKARPESSSAAEAWFHIGHHHEELAKATEDEKAKDVQVVEAANAFKNGIAAAGEKPIREKLQYKMGDMLYLQKKYAEASATLLDQVAKFPQGELAGPGRFLGGECLFQQDQYEKALPLFEQVVTEKVKDCQDQALYRAGMCAKNLDRWDVSLKHLDALTKQFPKFEQIYDAQFGLGYSLQNLNRHDEAIKIYEQITIDTETEPAARARFHVGEIAFARKKYEEAIEHFLLVAVGYGYKNLQARAHVEAGKCMMELKQNDKAIAQFEKVVKEHPDHPSAKAAGTLIMELKKGG